MRVIRTKTEEGLARECRIAVEDGHPCLQPYICHNNDPRRFLWRSFVEEKNSHLVEGCFTKHVGVRWDYAEWSDVNLSEAARTGEAKFIFTMRNLKDLFMSLRYHNFLGKGSIQDNLNRFERATTNSIKKISGMKDFCPVSVSEGRDLKRMLDWLGLEPTGFQREWMLDPPIINSSRKEGYVEFKKETEPQIEIPIDLEKRYWEVLEVARLAYSDS